MRCGVARFRAGVGETPAEYITRWRIHSATRLLREDGLSVAATARRVGYGTEAAFSNAFLRVMGVRPGAYKKTQRKPKQAQWPRRNDERTAPPQTRLPWSSPP